MWQPSQSSQSSVKETYVFNVDKPHNLLEIHAELMKEALRRDEELLYLLYSPICQEKRGPFGLHGTPSSHAVAVTSGRFVISENQHRKGIAPTVQSIPFCQVLYVELGTALPLGWFSIEFVVEDKPCCATLFFPATTGLKHFGSAVSEYRRMTRPSHDLLSSNMMGWADIWRHTPKTLVDHFEPVILKDELPFNLLQSSERWITRKMRRKIIPTCVSTNDIFVSTNFGFIYGTEDKSRDKSRDKSSKVGINVSCIPVGSVKSARIVEKRIYGSHLFVFKEEITRGGVAVEFDMPFDDSRIMDAEALVYLLTEDMRGDEVCIS